MGINQSKKAQSPTSTPASTPASTPTSTPASTLISIPINIVNLYTLPAGAIIDTIDTRNLDSEINDTIIPSFIKHYLIGFNEFNNKTIKTLITEIQGSSDTDTYIALNNITILELKRIQLKIMNLYKYKNNNVNERREAIKKMVLDIIFSDNMSKYIVKLKKKLNI